MKVEGELPATCSAQPLRLRTEVAFAWPMLLMLAAAMGLRAWIALQPGLGHDEDLALFARWIRGLAQHGLAGFYANEGFCDYPPLMLLLFRGVGAAMSGIAGPAPTEEQFRLAAKALACAGDLAVGMMLLLEGRRLLGARGGVIASSIYLLNPVSLYDSAYWGQMDSIYSALLLGSLMLVGRGRWVGAGALAAASLTAKFQSIAVLPLVALEAVRLGGRAGVQRLLSGGLIASALVAAPFAYHGVLATAFERAYVNVVGQYESKSKNAYNIWYLLGAPEDSDATPPLELVALAANGAAQVEAGDSWLLALTWRRISIIAFALAVATALSIYTLRPGGVSRYGSAALLALCFFLFPTEMHERYAYPAIALLSVWAAASASNERIFWALTIGLTLNLAAVLAPAALAPQIAAVNLAVFAALALAVAGVRLLPAAQTMQAPFEPAASTRVFRTFRRATIAGAIVALVFAGWLVRSWRSRAVERPVGVVYLSGLMPISAEQAWRPMGRDRSVSGGALRIGDTYYLHGLGAHAPARLSFEVPPDAQTFEAVVGIDAASRDNGSARLRVEIDGALAYESPVLRGGTAPVEVRVSTQGARTLELIIDPTDDGRRSDHVDLALARFAIRAEADRRDTAP